MAKVEYGSTLITSTGGDTIILDDSSLDINRVVLWTVSSDGKTSAGYYDPSREFTGGSAYGDENISHALTHYRNIGGTKTKVFEVDVTNLDVGEFSIDTLTLSGATILHFDAYED